MKKLLLLFVLTFVPVMASADDSGKCGDNVTYTFKEDTHTLTISGEGKMWDYSTKKSSPWYDYKANIIFLEIDQGITSIGSYAFYWCSSLTTVTIPNSVTSIGEYAFHNCDALSSVYISDISAWCGITFINEHSNPLYYAHHLFLDEKEILKLVIPDGITNIKDYTFCQCSNLISVTIPKSVTSIGKYAFSQCTSLTSVHISDISAWCGINFSDGSSNPLFYAHQLFLDGKKISDLVIPDGISMIKDYSFIECSGLSSVIIPNSVTSIGKFAFGGCSGFSSVAIPNSVTSIGNYAFNGCSSLTSVTIPSSVISLGEEAFGRNSSLTSVIISYGVTSIGSTVFNFCPNLTSVTIPNSVTSIGDASFYGCTGIKSVNIPNSVTSIGKFAFQKCSRLTSFAIPNSVTSIGESAFQDCGSITSVTLPEELRIISKSIFKGCKSLKDISIPATVEAIYQEAFSGCSSMESVKVLADTPPIAYENTFSNYDIPLFVPEASVSTYQATNPWSRFSSIKILSGGDAEAKICAKPTISYAQGKLIFNCETEGAQCQYSISDSDIKSDIGLEVSLSVTYNISVVATKSGYQNSETATATLCWIDVDPKTEGISNAVANVRAMPVMIQNNGNVLNISGAPEGSMISVFDLSGQMVGSAKAGSETTNISTSLRSGEVGIVKIGEKSVKVMIK